MEITILALGSRGDVQPYAALGKGLRSAGHRVRFVTFESFAPLVAKYGLELSPIQGDGQTLVSRAGANMWALVRSFGALAEGYAQDLEALLPTIRETDLLINQLPLALYGYDLAEKLDIPMYIAAVIPLTPTTTSPMIGFPSLPLPRYNRLTYHIAEQIGWQMFRPIINRWRREMLELPPHPPWGYFRQLHTDQFPVLNGISPHIIPRPPDWGDHVHMTGYWFPEDDQWQPPEGLLTFIQSGPPPVFVGFGSMPVRNPDHTTDVILEALRRSGQRGILHAGWAGIGDRPLPDDVFRIQYAPYNWLFPRMGMVVHHGGSGTTAFGFRAGVPTMAVPFVFDQFYWGKQIASIGVGPEPIPHRHLSARRLAERITATMDDRKMHQRAAELGHDIRSEDGIGRAIEIIESSVR